jgi:hypothetical protein
MAEFRFYRCEEVRCPMCGDRLIFLYISKPYREMLVQHPARPDCERSEKKFYAAPLIVELTEYA